MLMLIIFNGIFMLIEMMAIFMTVTGGPEPDGSQCGGYSTEGWTEHAPHRVRLQWSHPQARCGTDPQHCTRDPHAHPWRTRFVSFMFILGSGLRQDQLWS